MREKKKKIIAAEGENFIFQVREGGGQLIYRLIYRLTRVFHSGNMTRVFRI